MCGLFMYVLYAICPGFHSHFIILILNSVQILRDMADWCTQTEMLKIHGLIPVPAEAEEGLETYVQRQRLALLYTVCNVLYVLYCMCYRPYVLYCMYYILYVMHCTCGPPFHSVPYYELLSIYLHSGCMENSLAVFFQSSGHSLRKVYITECHVMITER